MATVSRLGSGILSIRSIIFSLVVISPLFFSSHLFAQASCGDFNGASLFSSEDQPVFLGFFGVDSAEDSILRPTGTYGSASSPLSVNNTTGIYGSSGSEFSAYDETATRPPKIVKNGRFFGFLSLNPELQHRSYNLDNIKEACEFTAERNGPQFLRAPLSTFGWGGLDVSFIGAWFNPDRNGEGIVIDFFTGTDPETEIDVPGIIVYYYTYDLNDNPMYLIGSTTGTGSPIELTVYRTSGTSFGDMFNKDDVLVERWGTLTLSLADPFSCGGLHMSWLPEMEGFSAGETDYERLARRAPGISCP